ncbi:hypothetical protein [Cuneatibacter caecimuris]|uniref:Uncharacterized protein n=1 Tax=Cuneatibacter caecimuris TaxID=1796618 RepID=A0A4Q7PK88_9FIRM|nr:hypothetical protein [Cuneatibacter caecimuris]RZT01134.1 hypothetical protein EV209_1575 [Cuneatibacter caecimuris]
MGEGEYDAAPFHMLRQDRTDLLILWERAKVEGREISSAFGKITAAVSAKTGRDRKND